MKKRDFCLFLLLPFVLLVLWECQPPRKAWTNNPRQRLMSTFANTPDLPDTVHFYLQESFGRPVSDTLLKACLDSLSFEQLQFGTGEPQFTAMGKFPLAKHVEACLLQTQEFWFGKQTLLLFDTRSQRFLSLLEVSSFYGGEGGQIATEAWWFRKQHPPRIFIKEAAHGLLMHEAAEEPTEYLSETGSLMEWKRNRFQAIANRDSSLFLKNLNMQREW